ncbi:immunoglobulin-like domain-containing protein, partial [Oceanisphaera ostreae]
MNTLATIVSLTGQAWAQASTGERRALKVGDRLTADEILVTAQGTVVGVDFGNGNELTFVGEQQVVVAEGADISATAKTESDSPSALAPLADSSATANDSSGLQYSAITVDSTGHNFVNLVRIHEIIEADGITPVTVARISEVLRPLGMSLPDWVVEADYRYEHRGEERYESGAIQRVPGLTVELQGAGPDGIYNESEIAADGTVSGHITLDDKVKEGDILVVTDGKGNELINRPVTSGDITNGIIVQVPVTPGQPSVEINASITQPNGTGSNDSDEKPVDNITPQLEVELQGAGPDGLYNESEIVGGKVPAKVTLDPNTVKEGDQLVVTTPDGTVLLERPVTQDDIDNGVLVDVPVVPGQTTVTVGATITDPAGNSSSAADEKPVDNVTSKLTIELEGTGPDGVYNESEITDGKVTATVTLDKDTVKVGDTLVVKTPNGDVLLERPVTQTDIDNGIPVQVPVIPGQTTVTVDATITDPAGNSSSANDEKPVDNLAPELSGSIPDRADEDADVIDLDIRGQFTDQIAPNTELDIVVTGLPKGLEYDPTTGKVTGTIDKSASQNGDGDIPTDGQYNVTISVTDPAGNSSEHDFVWSVSNPPPVAIADANTTLEDVTLTVTAKDGVLANDSDPDGDEPLRVTEFEVGGQKYAAGETAVISGVGNLTFNADGSYTFVPAPNFNGPVPTVNYTISDGEGGTASADLNIEVVPVLDIILSTTPEVIEGGKITVTATVESPVADKPLYIELETGEVIVIQVGESTGSIEVDSRSDDPYQQGNEDKTFTVKQAVGGNEHINESSLGSTVTSTIVDDADITRVKVTTTNVTEDEAGVTFVFELNNPPQTGSTVALTVDVNGTEHQVTVDANGRGELFIPTQNSDVYLDADSLKATVTEINGGNFEAVDVIGATATADITDTIDTVIAELTVDRSAVNEGAADLVYTVTLRDDSGNPIVAKNDVTVETSLGTIIIPTGSSTGTLDVPVQGDDVYLDGETVTNTITSVNEANAGQPGSFENLTFDNSTTTTTVSDTINTVTLALDNVSVNEGSGTAQITASLDHAPQTELVVTLSNGATITFGTDYVPGEKVSSTPFDINNGEDVYVDNSSVVVSVTGTTGGNFENLVTSDTATVTVTDTTTPVTAELTVDKTAISEGAADLVYTVTLKDAAGNLTPANNTVTVETTLGTITIEAGASSGTLTVPVQGDDVYVDGETLSNNITSVTETNGGTAGSFEDLGFKPDAVETVVSDTTDTTSISLTASPNLTEAGGDLTYTVTLDSPVRAGDDPVTVTFTDLNGDSQTITVSAGQSTGTATVTIPSSLFEDVYKEAPADVAIATDVTVAGGKDFEGLGVPSVGKITITDTIDDVILTLDDISVNEGTGTAQITASLDHAPETELTITLSNGATITFGPAYTPGDLVSSTPFDINNGEDVYVDNSSFDVFVKSTTGGNFENLVTTDTATVTVNDTTTPVTAELTVNKDAVNEGAADLVYTVTLKDAAGNLKPANNTVTVETTLGTITIEAGASSGTLTVPVQGDDVYVDGETLSNNITSVTEVNAGQPGSFEDLTFNPAAVDTVVSDTTDTTSISLTASPDFPESGGILTYTVTLSSEVRTGDEPIAVTFTDLNGDSQTITVNEGQSTGTATVTIPSSLFEDVYKEAPADVAIATDVTVAGGTDFEQLGTPTVGNITITDTPTDVTLTLNDVSVNEGSGTAQITASLDHAPETELVVTLSNGATLTFAPTYTPGDLVSSTPFDINNGEDVYVDNSSFDVFVKSTTGGNFENLVTSDTA